MEADILNTLETIRGYSFVTMALVVIFLSIKIFQIIFPFIFSFGDKLDSFLIDTNYKLLNQGKITKVINDCNDLLAKRPNDAPYTWLLAIAYYYNHDFDNSLKYFEKATFLRPDWKDDASKYIKSIKDANKSSNLTGAEDAPSS